MTDRVTQADIRRAFALAFEGKVASAFGANPESDLPAAFDNRHNIGKVALDYNPTYGGWVVIEYVGGSSGLGSAESNPYGYARRPSREMLAWLHGVLLGRKIEMGIVP